MPVKKNNIALNLILLSLLVIVFWLIPLDLVFEKTDDQSIQCFYLSPADSAWVEQKLTSLTLEEKIAQMIMPQARSIDTTKDKKELARLQSLVNDLKVGGFIFLRGEVEQQIDLTNYLQKISNLPLLISADYERGLGMRLEGAVEFPYSMAMGAANDAYLTYLMAKAVAEEGRAIGVHINFAPLLDINTDYRNPVIDIRSFSEDPSLVAKHSLAFIEGMRKGNMIPTVKHFPGHGATELDSHTRLPVINRTKTQLENNELVPFQQTIKAEVKSVMTGHLQVPAYEPEEGIPATLSNDITQDLLKSELGFNGIIFTDAMNMRAITNNFSQSEAAALAVKAGNDVILFPKDEWAAVEGIKEAVINGDISEKQIDESVWKILAIKRIMGLEKNKEIKKTEALKTIAKKEHLRLAKEIARKSLTLIKDENKLIPVNPEEYNKVVCIGITDNKFEETPLFQKHLEKIFKKYKSFELHAKGRQKSFDKAMKDARKADFIILPLYIYNFSLNKKPEYLHKLNVFLGNIIALNKPTIVISFGTPYLFNDLPGIKTYLCAYGETDIAQEVMVDALLGRQIISGKLPVSMPGNGFNIGYGLTYRPKGIFVPNEFSDTNYVFRSVDSLMNSGVFNYTFPGGVLLVGHRGRVVHHRAYGNYTYDSASPKVTTHTLFDLASVSKAVGTTSAAMILYDIGKLKLDDRIDLYLPEFSKNGKDSITIRQLLTHTSGLPAFKPFHKKYTRSDQVLNDIKNTGLMFKPGSKFLYSDLGMIILQKMIEEITHTPLDIFLRENLFNPLGMKNTFYNPDENLKENCAPTEFDSYWRGKTVQGEVHDETASLLGGVAGHAGLFSTAGDLALFVQTMLDNGRYGNKTIFNSATSNEWTSKQNDFSSRGIGWDTKYGDDSSAGELFSENSFGHTGFTGTSVWVDKDKELFVILLTNRIQPSRHNRRIISFRRLLHSKVAEAVSFE